MKLKKKLRALGAQKFAAYLEDQRIYHGQGESIWFKDAANLLADHLNKNS